MGEICELVPSQKGNDKLHVRGYLMVKDKRRGDLFYWCCDSRKSRGCRGRATTKLLREQHHLHKFVDHNHAPEVGAATVAKLVAQMKQQINRPADSTGHMVQSNATTHIPSHDTVPLEIQFATKFKQPDSFGDIAFPSVIRQRLNGELFLVR